MPPFNVRIEAFQRPGLNDPESLIIAQSIPKFRPALGGLVSQLRKGQLFEFRLDASDQAAAEKAVHDLASGFLTNHNLHDYSISVVPCVEE